MPTAGLGVGDGGVGGTGPGSHGARRGALIREVQGGASAGCQAGGVVQRQRRSIVRVTPQS